MDQTLGQKEIRVSGHSQSLVLHFWSLRAGIYMLRGLRAMNTENRLLVTDELVEFEK